MWRLYKYRMKSHIRDYENLFWIIVFPILLATFFGLAFSNLMSDHMFERVPVGIVGEEKENFTNMIKEAQSGEDMLFEVSQYDNLDQAIGAMDNNEIIAVFQTDGELKMHVIDQGVSQTIAKEFAERYIQTEGLIMSAIVDNPARMDNIIDALSEDGSYMAAEEVDTDILMAYFYALVAMTCLYGSFLGVKEVIAIEANQSDTGARIQVSPVKKSELYISGFLSAITVHFIGVMLLIVYLLTVQGVDFQGKIGWVILTCAMGSINGVVLGGFIACVSKKNENTKYALATGVSMILSFLAGLMMHDIRYIIMTRVPVLSYINPGNLVVDMLFSLDYYATLDRYILNMVLLKLITMILLAFIVVSARRRRYASI